MSSVYLDPSYWFSRYTPPLLPRGQAMVLAMGFFLTVLGVSAYLYVRRERPSMHSVEKKLWRRIESFLLNQWLVFWFLSLFAWFGVEYLGSKWVLAAWALYFLGRAIYFAVAYWRMRRGPRDVE